METISRRSLLAGASAFALAGRVQTPASAQQATPALPSGGDQADGSWQFHDDFGQTISLPTRPTRVVAAISIAAALKDLGFDVVGFFNTARDADGKSMAVAGDVPIDDIVDLGMAEEFDVEALIGLNAELLVGQTFDIEAKTIWPLPDDVLNQIRQVIPVAGIAYGDGTNTLRIIEAIVALGAALGVDVNSPELTAERDALTEAGTELETAIAAQPGLTTIFMSGSATGFWYAVPTIGDRAYYRSLGLDILGEGVTEEQSWETFGEVRADLIFNDIRAPGWWSTEQLTAEIPTFGLHPAVQAGMVGNFYAQYKASYRGFTPIVRETAEWISKADPKLV